MARTGYFALAVRLRRTCKTVSQALCREVKRIGQTMHDTAHRKFFASANSLKAESRQLSVAEAQRLCQARTTHLASLGFLQAGSALKNPGFLRTQSGFIPLRVTQDTSKEERLSPQARGVSHEDSLISETEATEVMSSYGPHGAMYVPMYSASSMNLLLVAISGFASYAPKRLNRLRQSRFSICPHFTISWRRSVPPAADTQSLNN